MVNDFDREWFGMPEPSGPDGFHLDVVVDIHEGAYTVLVCRRCVGPRRRVGSWSLPVPLWDVVGTAGIHDRVAHGEVS